MTEAQELARLFKVLSVDARVRIVQMLKERDLCVNALASRLGISAAAVSQHLRVLRDARLVEAQKRGYYVHYRVNEATLGKWQALAHRLLGKRSGAAKPNSCESKRKGDT